MIELKADNKSWMDVWGIPIVKYQINNSSKFRDRFASEISLLKELDFNPFAHLQQRPYFGNTKMNHTLVTTILISQW